MIRRFLVSLVLIIQLFSTKGFAADVDYSLIYAHGVESVEEIEALCSMLEKRLDELERKKLSLSLGLLERQRLIGFLTQNYPDMSGDLSLRVNCLVDRLEKLEALELKDRIAKRKKFWLKALGVALGVTAVAALLYYGVNKIKGVQADRDARMKDIRDRLQNRADTIDRLNQDVVVAQGANGLLRNGLDVANRDNLALAQNVQQANQDLIDANQDNLALAQNVQQANQGLIEAQNANGLLRHDLDAANRDNRLLVQNMADLTQQNVKLNGYVNGFRRQLEGVMAQDELRFEEFRAIEEVAALPGVAQ